MELKQYLKLSQQLVMTPQLQQAIKLLQLSRMELSELVHEQLTDNPVLEEGAEEPPERPQPVPNQADGSSAPQGEGRAGEVPEGSTTSPVPRDSTDVNWEAFVENYNSFSYAQVAGGGVRLSNEDMPSVEATLSRRSTLFDHLFWQLSLSRFDNAERELATQIIGNLNDDGYLEDVDLAELGAREGLSPEASESVLQRIQEFDPVGVASRDLRECLLIQARTFHPDNATVRDIIDRHLGNLESRNVAAILRDLKITEEAIGRAVRLISLMEPKPGRSLSSEEPQYITPDIYVFKVGDDFVTMLNEDGLPKLRISPVYRHVLASHKGGREKEYVQEKFRSAVWLIRSIHQRQSTIRKVTESIVRFQREFLERGIQHLRPLVLRDVAEDIGMHESTVSRVTTNKYVHTPQGIFELKYFFNSRIQATAGEDVASESVKQRIRQIVSGEPPRKPFSDQKIVELLEAQGIQIARRTVAKYREMQGILPSSRRKRMF